MKDQIQRKITDLKNEHSNLMQKRHELQQELTSITTRIVQIEGAFAELEDLIDDKTPGETQPPKA